MRLKFSLILGLILMVTIEAKYEFEITKTARDCLTEIGTDEATIRKLVPDEEVLPEDNEVLTKFIGCCLKSFFNDDNELIVDDGRYRAYLISVLTNRLEGKGNLATLIADDSLKQCKSVKADSKDKAAVKTFNCSLVRFYELIKKTV